MYNCAVLWLLDCPAFFHTFFSLDNHVFMLHDSKCQDYLLHLWKFTVFTENTWTVRFMLHYLVWISSFNFCLWQSTLFLFQQLLIIHQFSSIGFWGKIYIFSWIQRFKNSLKYKTICIKLQVLNLLIMWKTTFWIKSVVSTKFSKRVCKRNTPYLSSFHSACFRLQTSGHHWPSGIGACSIYGGCGPFSFNFSII